MVNTSENLKKLVICSNRNNAVKIGKTTLNENAIRFKINIEKELDMNDSSDSAGARYECIYKNLLRDIRQYYSHKYELFVKEQLELAN